MTYRNLDDQILNHQPSSANQKIHKLLYLLLTKFARIYILYSISASNHPQTTYMHTPTWSKILFVCTTCRGRTHASFYICVASSHGNSPFL